MDTAILQYRKIRELSNSSRATFRSCPRKSQLAKFSSGRGDSTIHTVFGTAVGAGIQTWFGGEEYIPASEVIRANLSRKEAAILAVFLAWNGIAVWDTDQKSNKSLGHAIFMVEKFIADCESGELPFLGWKYVGAEVGFRLRLPGDFYYRGYIDLVLISPEGLPAVLEFKTTGKNFTDRAEWENAEQGTSYSLVIPAIVPGATKYLMHYVIGLSKTFKWVDMPFIKTDQMKLDFVQDLLIETKVIEFYEKSNRFPTNGNACYSFMRQCPFFGICKLPTDRIVDLEAIKLDGDDDYEYEVDLSEL